MKALEILKNPSFVIPANGNHIYKKESIEEAIAELEALQAPKTCETCKYNTGDCAVLELLTAHFGSEPDSCICHNYEPKDNA